MKFILKKLNEKIKKKFKNNNIVNSFQSKINEGEREVEAIVFAAAEPLRYRYN